MAEHAATGVPYVLEVNLCPDMAVGAADSSDVATKLNAAFGELERC